MSVRVSGRRRLHVLASPQVAVAVEALAAISPLLPVESLRDARTGSRLQVARVCYSHLAGSLAVAIARELVAAGVVRALEDEADGLDHPLLAALGIDGLSALPGPPVRSCPDWTEHDTHLAGRLGGALLTALLEQDWVRRRPRDRALNITATGETRLAALGIAAGGSAPLRTATPGAGPG